MWIYTPLFFSTIGVIKIWARKVKACFLHRGQAFLVILKNQVTMMCIKAHSMKKKEIHLVCFRKYKALFPFGQTFRDIPEESFFMAHQSGRRRLGSYLPKCISPASGCARKGTPWSPDERLLRIHTPGPKDYSFTCRLLSAMMVRRVVPSSMLPM